MLLFNTQKEHSIVKQSSHLTRNKWLAFLTYWGLSFIILTKNHSVKLVWAILLMVCNQWNQWRWALILSFTSQMGACFLTKYLWLRLMECRWHSQEPSSATLLPSTTCTGRTWRRDSGTLMFVPVLDFKPGFFGLIPTETWFDCIFQPELKGESRGTKGRYCC